MGFSRIWDCHKQNTLLTNFENDLSQAFFANERPWQKIEIIETSYSCEQLQVIECRVMSKATIAARHVQNERKMQSEKKYKMPIS